MIVLSILHKDIFDVKHDQSLYRGKTPYVGLLNLETIEPLSSGFSRLLFRVLTAVSCKAVNEAPSRLSASLWESSAKWRFYLYFPGQLWYNLLIHKRLFPESYGGKSGLRLSASEKSGRPTPATYHPGREIIQVVLHLTGQTSQDQAAGLHFSPLGTSKNNHFLMERF